MINKKQIKGIHEERKDKKGWNKKWENKSKKNSITWGKENQIKLKVKGRIKNWKDTN